MTMKYVIVSERVGTPGEIYNPDVVVNLSALISGGFIKPLEESAKEPAEEPTTTVMKSAKNNSKKASTEE